MSLPVTVVRGGTPRKVDEDVIVEDLDTDVSVEASSDERASECHNVADGLPGVNRYSFK
jgi:hypothetical protein